MVGIYAGKFLLYVHQCAKIPAANADIPYSTKEVPVLLPNVTEIPFTNPITQVVHLNYTLTVCDPIVAYMYRTSEGTWMYNGTEYSLARDPETL